MGLPVPSTLLEAVRAFADPQVAHDFFVAIRWPNGMACPRPGCGSADVAPIKGRNAWRCRECDRQFTAKVGTIFEDSPIGFDKWLPAMWLLSADRNGVSSCEVARSLGVTQKTAWFMLHRLRLAMQTETFERLTGEVEADETYVGGKTRRGVPKAVRIGKAGKKAKQDAKTVVMGRRERGGRVRAMAVKDNRRTTLLPMLFPHLERGAVLYTDALKSYADAREAYVHQVIDHSVAYVEGRVHTNNIENFWSVLKRTLGGTSSRLGRSTSTRTFDEQVFRFK
ncbi:MAG TPA: IS1595 family transposase [Candidatus Sulfotelmatobacter sp.]|nr:IS1595 family transposase [Candidatus Sulfotelmatobacter sp.]